MRTDKLYYRPSGKAPAAGVLGMFITGIAAAVVGAFIYVRLIEWIPLVYFNALLVLGYGFVVGMGVALACKKGKVRKPSACFLAGLVSGTVAVYLQWAYYLALNTPDILGEMGEGTFSLTLHFLAAPGEIWEMLRLINPEGMWTIKGSAVNGTFLWVVWGIELLGILGMSLLMAGVHTRDPYSESEDRWMDEQKLQDRLTPVTNGKDFVATLERGDYSPLWGLAPTQTAEHFCRLTLYTCTGDADAYVSLQNVRLVQKKKETKEETESVFKYLHIPAKKAQELVAHLAAMQAPQPEAPVEAPAATPDGAQVEA